MFSSFAPIVYVQISPERLTLKNVKNGESISEAPEVAVTVGHSPKVMGFGTQARVAVAASHDARLINPFGHPRSLVSDFNAGQLLMRHQLRRLLSMKFLSLGPHVVVHPLGDPAGGLTQIERRALREMARGAGASRVHLWTGRELTDQELLARQAPAGGDWE